MSVHALLGGNKRVHALQYSGGWGHQSQERPVSVRALQYSRSILVMRGLSIISAQNNY